MGKQFDVSVKLTGDSKGAEQAAKRTEGAFKRLTGSLKQNWLGVAAAVAGTVLALRGLTRVIGSTISAAVAQETAVRKMNSALKSAGDYSKEASDDMQEYAKSLAHTNATTDQAILAGLALAKSFGQTNEQAKLMVATAYDFAVAADINFTEALRRIGRAAHGSTEDVAKFAPEIANLTKEELLAGKATEALAKRYRNLASEAMGEAERAVRNFGTALGELREAMGEGLTKNKDFVQGIENLSTGIENNREGIERTSASITNFVLGAGQKWIDMMQWAAEKHTDAVLAIDKLRPSQQAAEASTAALLQVAHKLGTTIEGVEERMKNADHATEAWDDSLQDLRETVSAETRILKELADSAKAFTDATERLGIALEKDVRAGIEQNNRDLELLERRFHLGEISAGDFARAQQAVAAANRELSDSLSPATSEVERLTGAYEDASGAVSEYAADVDRAAVATERFTVSTRTNTQALQENRNVVTLPGGRTRYRDYEGRLTIHDWSGLSGPSEPLFAGRRGGVYTTYTPGRVVQDANGRLRVV